MLKFKGRENHFTEKFSEIDRMPEDEEFIPDMPENDSPLAPIVSWYNLARQRANAPSLQLGTLPSMTSVESLRC